MSNEKPWICYHKGFLGSGEKKRKEMVKDKAEHTILYSIVLGLVLDNVVQF